jgi:DNA polymerase-3 subunit epsilon
MRLYLDTETTNFYNFQNTWDDPSQPAILQIAAVLETEQGKTVAAMSAIISQHMWNGRSEKNILVDTKIVELCGIDSEDVEMYGQEPQLIYNQFNHLLRSATLLIGHNISFDVGIIRRFAKDLEMPATLLPETYCTMHKSAKLVGIPGRQSGYKKPKLGEAYFWATGRKLQNAHDALSDVYGCRQVYRAIKREEVAQG